MPTLPEFSAIPVGHLPVLRALIDRLGIHDILDRSLPKLPGEKVMAE